MNHRYRIFLFSVALLPVLSLGCNNEPTEELVKRPVAGDVVKPVILLGKTWKQNGPVLVSSRLQVQGPDDAKPRLLQLSEVPYEIVPSATLTFFDGELESLHIPGVQLVRDC
ncbi:MAG: hypothetical protein ACFCD0_18670 [Gemmataceae bacterium]